MKKWSSSTHLPVDSPTAHMAISRATFEALGGAVAPIIAGPIYAGHRCSAVLSSSRKEVALPEDGEADDDNECYLHIHGMPFPHDQSESVNWLGSEITPSDKTKESVKNREDGCCALTGDRSPHHVIVHFVPRRISPDLFGTFLTAIRKALPHRNVLKTLVGDDINSPRNLVYAAATLRDAIDHEMLGIDVPTAITDTDHVELRFHCAPDVRSEFLKATIENLTKRRDDGQLNTHSEYYTRGSVYANAPISKWFSEGVPYGDRFRGLPHILFLKIHYAMFFIKAFASSTLAHCASSALTKKRKSPGENNEGRPAKKYKYEDSSFQQMQLDMVGADCVDEESDESDEEDEPDNELERATIAAFILRQILGALEMARAFREGQSV